MNILTDPEHLKNLMRSLKLKPKDYLGQNFLISEDVLDEIIDAAGIKKTDTVVEIGPGLGVLTQRLTKVAGKVIAIEKDQTFIQVLKNYFKENKSVEIINQDVLKFNFSELKDFKVVANIPYYLTSHLIQNLLELKNKPKQIVLMVQKEVGERIVAEAGELSVLGISVQIFADAQIVTKKIPDQVRDGFGAKKVPLIISKTNFWPVPKVDSCIVSITPKDKFKEISDIKLFFRIVKIAFAGKRKQIHNTLTNGLHLPKEEVLRLLASSKITPSARPQDINVEQWIQLYLQVSKVKA